MMTVIYTLFKIYPQNNHSSKKKKKKRKEKKTEQGEVIIKARLIHSIETVWN